MTEEKATAAEADGANAPTEDDVKVDAVEAIDASAKPADQDPEEAAPAAEEHPEGHEPEKPASKPQRLPEWAEKKLAEASFEAREAKRRAKELEDKLAERNAKASDPEPNAADDAAARANAPAGGYASQADFDAAVRAEADRRAAIERQAAAEQDFNNRCNTAYAKGKEAYKDDFDVAVRNLQSAGAMTPEMLSVVLEADDPSRLLYELGSNPDHAASLLSMTPAKRAFEIARLSQPSPKKPVPLSKAPPPVTQIDGTARVTAAPTDADDDETFFRKREAELKAAGRW